MPLDPTIGVFFNDAIESVEPEETLANEEEEDEEDVVVVVVVVPIAAILDCAADVIALRSSR